MPEHSTPLELAQSYVTQGWPVFPCRSAAEEIVDDATGEVTTLGEKTPLTMKGFKAATTFGHIIKRWWSDWPDAAIGLPTGERTKFFALDIDNKPGGANGFDWLAEMEAEHGPLPTTARVMSPNGGMHVYFNYVVGTRNRGALGAGVDVRSEGGYVVAAGSVMSDGRAYRWADDTREIADAPAWLLDLLLPKSAPTHTHYGTATTNNAYVDAAVDRELADLASMPMGNRNNALNDASFSLGQWVGGGHLPESEARASLQDVARGWGRDWARCCKTIENGLKAGAQNPRHPPEPEFQQDNTRLVDVKRMLENARKKAEADRARHDPVREESAHEVAPDSEIIPSGNDTATEPPTSEEPPTDNLPVTATPFKWIDPKTLPRREFAFGVHYIRKYVSVTVSPGGLGKTSNSIVEALAMASGKDLTGTKPPQRLKVWLFNAEDPRDELERRIMAACIHFKLKPEDIEGHLFLDTGREQELVVAIEDKKAGVRIQEPIVDAVARQMFANEIDVMIVDPFVSTHQVNENDNGAIDKVAKLWAQVANDTNAAVDIVHHLRKVADREATVEDARGAVSLIGAARSVRVLNRMSDEQAEQAGVPAADRFGYFSINYGKSNLTPLSSKLDWRRLVSTPLGNGRGLTKPQDFAPVVTEWQWPSAEEVASEVTEEQLSNVKSLLDGTDWRASDQSSEWAGYAVANVLGLDADDKGDKKRIKRLLGIWADRGEIVQHRLQDLKSRKMVPYLKSGNWVDPAAKAAS